MVPQRRLRKAYLFKAVGVPGRTRRYNQYKNRQLASAATLAQQLSRGSPQADSRSNGFLYPDDGQSDSRPIMSSSESDEETSSSQKSAVNEDPAPMEHTEFRTSSETSSDDFSGTNTSSSEYSADECNDPDDNDDEYSEVPCDLIDSSIHQEDAAKQENVNQQSWHLVPEHEDDLGLPLCDVAGTTKGDALLLCLAFGLRHGLSWKGMEDLLKLINCLFDREVVKATKYFLQKYMDAGQGKMTYHVYCPYCHRYLGNKDNFFEAKVGCQCGQTLKDISDASSFFVSLDLGDQIKNLLRDKCFVEALQYRFNRKKKREDAYEDIFDGQLYRKFSESGQVLSHWYNMSYMFNTDGFPVGGKSGKQTCWPIYVQINELPPKLRSKFMLLAGVYVGKTDPNMTIFMYPFVEEANVLSTTGITWYMGTKKINSKIIPLCACVDTPARHKILNTTAFNGRYGCSLCYIKPQDTKGGYRYPIPMEGCQERTHKEILVDAIKAHANRALIKNKKNRRVRGVKGPTPLHNLNYFDLVQGVRPDTMHSILLGNAKHFMSILHANAGKSFYIGSEVRMEAISVRLLSIRPPASLMRTPRNLNTFKSWQAKEWRSWLLFYSVPCLMHIIPIEYVSLLNLLSSAVHIILKKSITEAELKQVHILLLRYLFLFQQYFGENQMVINIHLLLHLKKSIEYLGPAWTNVAFSFEGSNKYLLGLKKGASSIAQEIAKKYLTFQSLPLLCQKYASSERVVEFCQNLSGRPLLKSAQRFGDVVLVGAGRKIDLDLEERNCLSSLTIEEDKDIMGYSRFIMGGIRYCAAHYGRATKTDDSYISVGGESKARIHRIIRYSDGTTQSIYVLARELLIDEVPVFNDEFGRHSHFQKVLDDGQLFALRPEDISGQCVAMFLESGRFICDVPYGCYSDS